jgi:hypothetical protein
MLVIKELGVEVPLSNGPSDLSYKIVSDPSYGLVAELDTSQISQSSSCSPGRLGRIVKVQGTIPSGVKPFYTTDESGNQLNYLLKQFSGFYVQHLPSQNGCQLPGGGTYPDKTTSLKTVRAVDGLQLTQ